MSTCTVVEAFHESEKMKESNTEDVSNNAQVNSSKTTNVLPEDLDKINGRITKARPDNSLWNTVINAVTFQTPIKWSNVIAITAFHLAAFIFMFTTFPFIKWQTALFTFFMGGVGGFGVTGGVHRYWTHKSFKATLPLRIILAICYSVAGQNTIFDWVRDHRVHHKFSETDADPHNANRGFFFSHVGWLMIKKHPDVVNKGKQIDMSDILADPVVTFHQRHFTIIKMLFCFILPTIIPVALWGEYWHLSFQSQIVRYIMNLNFTWCVNSAAHMWGQKPYDRRIQPVENPTVSLLAMGEGWHNYHHVFPWDYKAAELGSYSLNITTLWIDFFAKIGWAYDLKQPSQQLIMKTIESNGDGSHAKWEHHMEEVPIEADEKYKSS